MRLSANLALMFTELPFLERFSAAAAAGFSAVECQFLNEDADVSDVAAALRDAGVELDLFNAPRGHADAFGLALADDARFDDAIRWTRDAARELGCAKVHVLSGLCASPDADRGAAFDRVCAAYARADAVLRPAGVTVLAEPLNPIDRPRYWLNSLALARRLIEALPGAGVRLQFDAYHVSRIGLDVSASLRAVAHMVGHVQIAAAADRGEPDRANEAIPLFQALAEIGYDGCVGCEYIPRAGTEEGLQWARPWLRARANLFSGNR